MKYSNITLYVYYVLVSFILISTTNYVVGERGISKAEEDDIERQLRVLNKKPVKTITNKFGDIIDCIDIYKQPAFDHPLLKDHKIQMSPNSVPGETTSKSLSSSSSSVFRGEGCPPGTVPIRRTTRDDLVNAKTIIEKTKPNNPDTYPNRPPAYHFVFADEVIDEKRYYGGTASISIHDLTVYHDEFSTSQIWITNGPLEEINTIEFGLRHDPLLFGDSRPRLFSTWTSDGHQTTGCFNTMCPGFVQLHPNVTFGQQFAKSSIYGGAAYDIHLMVYLSNDRWWLRMGPKSETSEIIGYWPKDIFTHLAESASIVRYGGLASKTSQNISAPPMGNGFLPQLEDFKKTAFMASMKYLNKTGYAVKLDRSSMQTKNSAGPDCYGIMLAGPLGDLDMAMVYGGPGGMCA